MTTLLPPLGIIRVIALVAADATAHEKQIHQTAPADTMSQSGGMMSDGMIAGVRRNEHKRSARDVEW